jgi:hypothetical protein
MDDEKKVIVIEPTIKSDAFFRYLDNLIRETLNENNILFLSIKKDGFYFIVELTKSKEIVFTMDLLSKISGISFIFIAKCLIVNFSTLSQTVIQIGKEVLLPDESFSITIRVTSGTNGPKENDNFLFFKKDLEFLLISELSSLSPGTKHVTNESEADKPLFVLIGSDFAYVSISLTKNKEIIPFKFFKETVVCPIYNDCSFLSLISILDNGFFPIPFIFHKGESHLRQILKTFEKIIKRYPIKNIVVNLIDLADLYIDIDEWYLDNGFNSNQSERMMMRELIDDEIVVTFLLYLRVETNFICLPLLPYLHPVWFFKKNILMSFELGKIPLTPFLFNYEFEHNLKNFYGFTNNVFDDKSADFGHSYLDVTQEGFEHVFQKVKTNLLMGIRSWEVKQFNLGVGKDDFLDILDSV